MGWRDLLSVTYKYLSSFLNTSDFSIHLKTVLCLLSTYYVASGVFGFQLSNLRLPGIRQSDFIMFLSNVKLSFNRIPCFQVYIAETRKRKKNSVRAFRQSRRSSSVIFLAPSSCPVVFVLHPCLSHLEFW